MAARPDIDPNGKRSRPAASKDELEQYGVWVKAEPQDIAAEPEGPFEMDNDFSLPEEGEALPEESFLTEEEERLLGSFEDIDTGGTSDSAPLPEPDADFSSLPDIEDFEVSGSSDFGANAPSGSSGSEEPSMDLSVEDLETGFSEPSFGPSTDLDMDTIEGLESEEKGGDSELPIDFGLEEGEDLSSEEVGRQGTLENRLGPDLEDVSAEFLDVGTPSSKKRPAPVAQAPAHDVTDEFLAEERRPRAPVDPAKPAQEIDFEPLDIELQFEDTIPSSAEATSETETGFGEIGEFDDFLSKSPHDKESESFDDLAALEQDLSSPERTMKAPLHTPPPSPPPAPASEPSLANELLLKIANELSSIRSELVTLKAQMSAARPESVQAPIQPIVEAPEPEPASAGGFFDEEDDEKIALTGDELDNILNSADFTEEAPPSLEGEASPSGEAASPEIDFMQAMTGRPEAEPATILDEGILPESGDYSAAPEPVERISLDEESLVPPSPEKAEGGEEDESIDTLLKLADEGIQPVTPAPEDTSYLEEPLGPAESMELEEASFVEAPLVEPDLSDLSVDLPLDETGMELEGELSQGQTEEILPDMALDLAAESLSSETEVETLDADAISAPLPEFEESEYEEISLATEGEVASGAEDEDSFVEFLDEGVASEEVLHREDSSSPYQPRAARSQPEAQPQPAVARAASAPLHLPEESEDLTAESDADSFNEEAIHLSSRESRKAESALESAKEDFDLQDFEPEGGETGAEEAEQALQSAPLVAEAEVSQDPADKLKSDIRSVLAYLDRLLESLPEEKIEEFAHSEHFDTYKKLFEELGLV